MKKINENSEFRVCKRCGDRFLHHFFFVCNRCREVYDDKNVYLPSPEKIAEEARKLKEKGLKEMVEDVKGTKRGMDESNVRCYSVVRQIGELIVFRQGVA